MIQFGISFIIFINIVVQLDLELKYNLNHAFLMLYVGTLLLILLYGLV